MTKAERDRRHDAKRREQKPWRAFYKTKIWQDIRKRQFAAQPLCERCERTGRPVPATVVNHVHRHEGDWQKFIAGPFESLCKPCHDGPVHSAEALGYSNDIDPATGLPADPNHPFNR